MKWPTAPNLDAGETEALALALQIQADAVLLDEAAAKLLLIDKSCLLWRTNCHFNGPENCGIRSKRSLKHRLICALSATRNNPRLLQENYCERACFPPAQDYSKEGIGSSRKALRY